MSAERPGDAAQADPDPRACAAPAGPPAPRWRERHGPWRARLVGERDLWEELRAELLAAALERRKLRRLAGGRFLKAAPLSRHAPLRHGLRAALGLAPPRLREHANLAWLRAHGFAAPRPLLAAVLWRGGLPRYQLLCTAEVAGARTLREALADAPPERRRALARSLGATVGRLHELGFVHRDLFPRNVLVAPSDERPWLVDAWRGGPRPGLRGPAWDLGCLALFSGALLGADERALFDAYFATRPAADRRSLLARAARHRRVLLARLGGRRPEGALLPPAGWRPPF